VTGKSRTRGLIDTNIVIHLAALDPVELPEDMVICAVTLAELSAGPHHTDDPAERARRISVLQHAEATFDPLPFDANAARAFGRVSAAVRASGRQTRRRLADLMIAATAIVAQVPLYTTNADDFRGLDHVLTIHPVTRPSH
jgi:predicted nucleic acid-binding protein